MALTSNRLADELVEKLKTEITKTNYDSITGAKTTVTETVYPPKKEMEKLAVVLIDHIQKNSEVMGVEGTVNATVAPGIVVTTGAGPGSTTSPGTATGTAMQPPTNLVRVK